MKTIIIILAGQIADVMELGFSGFTYELNLTVPPLTTFAAVFHINQRTTGM